MKKHFITGLILFLPLAIAVAALVFLINLFTEPFVGIVSHILQATPFFSQGFFFLSADQTVLYLSKLIILVILFFAIVCLGAVARGFLVDSLFRLGDKILLRIPVFNTVYKTSRDIITTIFVTDKDAFKQVVLIPFPHAQSYALGLIARDSPVTCSESTGEDLVSVFLPTTPNPTTGFLLMLPRASLILLEMSPEDALKYILSCGMISPVEHATPRPS